MIVPMKKVSLIIRGDKKSQTLKTLRKLGIMHIEIGDAVGENYNLHNEQIAALDRAAFAVGKPNNADARTADLQTSLDVADKISALTDESAECLSEMSTLNSELERLREWGDVDPEKINALAADGICVSLCEMPTGGYNALPDSVKTVRLGAGKGTVRFMYLTGKEESDFDMAQYTLAMPKISTEKMRARVAELSARIDSIGAEISSLSCYLTSLKNAKRELEKRVEFESCVACMESEELSDGGSHPLSVACFTGYIEAENVEKLRQTARDNSWGLLVQEPTEEDNVPTKLKNNRFVSLIYPIMDFLGTVPGYFEYDISSWFLMFILIFFGIIFGDGGYGLLICAVAAIPIFRNLIAKKKVSPVFLLVGLFGLSTVLWGTLTCTWFGLSPEHLPEWLKGLSVPVISNVYADKIWALPWTADGVGLTTKQNLQIFCFTLALIQLSVAHVLGAIRNRRSMKILGDIGSILQLLGIYYMVLSFVVNAEVFTFSLVLGNIPVGTVAIVLIAVGFVMSFVFSNYAGSILKSVLSSLTNIVSILLGVVNVFSDIVSYIRLWAVGLAGAAISTTVNELASPLLGNFMLMIIAIVLLIFGHGLNMILNVLSVIVHGIRLNTLEFSSHLDMSWSGHKFKPFEN